jgi:putative DNA primase/helicase
VSSNPETARNEAERDAEAERNARIQSEARALLEAEAEAVRQADLRNPVLPSIRANPVGAAQIVLERFFTKNELKQLLYYRETWYSYYDRLWSARTDDDISHFVHNKLLLCRTVNSENEIEDFNVCRANVSEVCFQIQQLASIPSHYKAPCELKNGRWVEVNAAGKMVCKGTIVDMLTGEVNSNHALFIPNGADWEYKPKAKPPAAWLEFLSQLFGEKQDEIDLLQEWFGYVLSGDTWAQKGIIIVGPPRAGKGIIGHVLSNLLGKSMVSSPALHAIGTRFGLEDLIDKRMCLISDARLSSRQDIFAVIETLLRIIGGDSVSVDRKNKGALNLDLVARIMLLSNEMPQLSDNSTAINNRFLIIQLTESFLGREDPKLLVKLMKELPAIANWAMDGYKRLIAAYRFSEPQSSKDARDEWYEENNPLAQFVEDSCIVGVGHRVEVKDFYTAYKTWCEEQGHSFMAANAMSRRLAAMLGSRIKRIKSNGQRYFEGIGSNVKF